MAKTFYYPINELAGATVTDGYFTSGPPNAFASSDKVTNEERIIDQSIGSAVSGFDNTGNGAGSEDCIQINLGSPVAVDFVAIHSTASTTDDIDVYNADSATVPEAVAISNFTSLDAGWKVQTFNSTTKQYWYFVASTGEVSPNEILFGNAYAFDFSWNLQGRDSNISGSEIITSYGGNEFTNKRHAQIKTWNRLWKNISSGMKTSLETFQTAVEIDRLKFLYSENGTSGAFHWVRMTQPLDFTEVANNRYSTPFSMRQQLQ